MAVSKDPASSRETLILAETLIGKAVGPYVVRGLLGQGGMGVVYRAYDASLDREVALKVLPQRLSVDQDYAERFIREARLAAKLDHPRVVPVYAAGTSEHGAWIAMQLVRGRTLAEELKDGMRPTLPNVVRLARQAAEGLAAAHRAGLIHRDIKPGNLIVDAAGDLKILDFGLARPTNSAGHTQEGTYLGTPEYSSPEQCQSHDIDGRADLYSLGAVMYEMLGGRIPHVAETPLALFSKIVSEEPLPLRTLNPNVPPSLSAVVTRLLSKDRDRRYATAETLIADLDKLHLKAAPGSHETRVIGPADRARVAAWTLAACLAAVLVGAIIHNGPGTSLAGGSPAPAVSGTTPIPTPEPARRGTRLVFLDFKPFGAGPELAWMESGIPEILASSLAQHDGVAAVDREEVLDAMRRDFGAKITSGGSDDISGASAQGCLLLESLKATHLVRGKYIVAGEEMRILVTVLGRTGEGLEVVKQLEETGRPSQLLGMSDRLAEKIAVALVPREEWKKLELGHGDPSANAAKCLAALEERRQQAGEYRGRRGLVDKAKTKAQKRNDAGPTAPGASIDKPATAEGGAKGGAVAHLKDAKDPELNAAGAEPEKSEELQADHLEKLRAEVDDEKEDAATKQLLAALKEYAEECRKVEGDLPVQELGVERSAK